MPTILVTNDDGITSRGIRTLIEAVKPFGKVVVVAPDSPQSGQGHAISIHGPIYLRRSDIYGEDVEAYECSGTPVDCVKLAKSIILKGRKADLCVSGINHGTNHSINILYSGTMSAAMEASLEGIPSIGFSLDDYRPEADFSAGVSYIQQLVEFALLGGIQVGTLLNVNIPALPFDQLKGIKICRQGEGRWVEGYLENKDPRDRPYYWLTGRFEHENPNLDEDSWAMQNGYISVVPAHHDLTNYAAIPSLKVLENNVF